MTHLEDSLERVQVAALTLHDGAEDETSDNLKEAMRNYLGVISIYHIASCKLK